MKVRATLIVAALIVVVAIGFGILTTGATASAPEFTLKDQAQIATMRSELRCIATRSVPLWRHTAYGEHGLPFTYTSDSVGAFHKVGYLVKMGCFK